MRFGCNIRAPHTHLGYRSSFGLNVWILLVINQISSGIAVDPPVNLSVSNVTATTAVLTWEPGDVIDDVFDGYYIGCAGILYQQLYVSHTERIDIINLRPLDSYNVTVQTRTTSGERATSEQLQFRTTLENTPPLNVSATRLTATQAKVEWTKPLTNMTILGYTVYYNTISGVGQPIDTWWNHTAVGAQTAATIVSSLSPNEVYMFMMTAFSAEEQGPLSDEVFVDVLEVTTKAPRVVPDSPRGIILRPLNSTAILAKWKPPRDLPENIEGYYVFYREVLEDDELSSERNSVYSNKTKVVINGLKTGTTYAIEVTVWDGVGEGLFSRSKHVTTAEDCTKFQREELRLLQHNADTNERIAALLLKTYDAVVEIAKHLTIISINMHDL